MQEIKELQYKHYIKIPNEVLINSEVIDNQKIYTNPISLMGTAPFTLLCYLIMEQGYRSSIEITIKKIMNFMSWEGFKDPKTVRNHLKILDQRKYITISVPKENFNKNEEITVQCLPGINLEKNYTVMSEDLFRDQIKSIGHEGWSILCLLSKLHNYTWSNKNDYGYANPAQDTIARSLGIGLTTVKKYIDLLKNRNLIRIEPQKSIILGEKNNGDPLYHHFPNHYIVFSRVPGHKYYLPDVLNKIIKEERPKFEDECKLIYASLL